MPTKIEVNVQTGVVVELELQDEELAMYQASLIAQANEPEVTPEPTLAEIVAQLQTEITTLKANQ